MRLHLCLLLLASPALADPPAAAAEPTLDELIAKLADLKKQQSEVERASAATRAALAAKWADYQKKLAELGVDVGPAPRPPDPKPADPLAARLRAALDADPADPAKKREQAKDLAELYRQAAELAGRPEVATSGELLRRVRDAAGVLVGPDALKGVRREVAAELGLILPADAALADEQRKAVAELFKKLATILDGF